MICPRCQTPMRPALEATPRGRIELDYCPACRGIWFDSGELAALLGVGNVEAFEVDSPLLTGEKPTTLRCPRHREQSMQERRISTERAGQLLGGEAAPAPVRLDQCPACSGIWLDGGELDALVQVLRDRKAQPFLAHPDELARPTSAWLWMFMFLTGLPVEQWQPRARRPYVVVALILACLLAFMGELASSNPEALIQKYGLVPALVAQQGLWPFLSHMFLHGGFTHLLGNLYFLWVFGDNVEDRLGHLRFLWLYLIAGLVAAGCHCLFTNDPMMPVVGASGAISGVMAAYALLFPKARLVSLIFVFQVRWQTSVYLLAWLGLQVIGAAMNLPNIAWWAHIGGFFAGAAIAWRWRPGARLIFKSPPPSNPTVVS